MLHRNNALLDYRRLEAEMRRLGETLEPPPRWPGEAAWSRSIEGRTVSLGAGTQPPRHAEIGDYTSLLSLPVSGFVEAAFWNLLGRLPNRQEHHLWHERLLGGWNRERMLLQLDRQAAEQDERPKAPALPGLAKGLSRAHWKFQPKIGRLVRWTLSLLRLDVQRERLEHLAQLQDARYQALLDILRDQGRELAELKQRYLGLQANHAALHSQMEQVRRSAMAPSRSEAIARGASVTGAEQAFVTMSAEGAGERDFYRALEARFRGSPVAIAELMREHLDTVRRVGALMQGYPLLDLGCGRGEWLSLLVQEGITAHGVDLNEANVRACRKAGLAVSYQDAIAALEACDSDSLGMVTSFHLVEHLTHEQQRRLLAQALRALAPGGALLLETPNPQNLLVGSCNFYLDPTHTRPIPPDFLAFLAEYVGFEGVEIHPLHPVAEQLRLQDDSETALRLNHYLYGPQDYALFALKPGQEAHPSVTATVWGGEQRENGEEQERLP